MHARTKDPKHWHDRAALMRALAATMADVETHAIMLRLADDYDKLADRTAPLSVETKILPRFYLRKADGRIACASRALK